MYKKIQKSFVHFLRKVLLCAPKCINIKWCTTPRQYCIASPMIKSIFNAHSNSIFRRGYIFAEGIHAVASGQRSTEHRRHAQDRFGDLFDFLYHLVCWVKTNNPLLWLHFNFCWRRNLLQTCMKYYNRQSIKIKVKSTQYKKLVPNALGFTH